MKLVVACVGRSTQSPEQALCDDYLKRARGLGRKLGITKTDIVIVETSRASHIEKRLSEEAERLLSQSTKSAHRVALDERGKQFTSENWAKYLAGLRDTGVEDLVFFIGGPDGLAETLCTQANERLALGTQTWPHLLVRAMLTEQIYRAFAILSGHPYHRGTNLVARAPLHR